VSDRLIAKAKLEEAIQEYVEVCSGLEGTVRTDYVLSVSAVNMHVPMEPHATFYFHETSGPMHSIAGLKFMFEEHLKEMNREEAELDNQ